MNNQQACTTTTHVQWTHIYNEHICSIYTNVQLTTCSCNTCTTNTHVHPTHMYTQHTCTTNTHVFYTNVQLTHINNQHTCNTNVQPTHMYNHYKVYCFCKVNEYEYYRNFT